jgi:hypothetical protein
VSCIPVLQLLGCRLLVGWVIVLLELEWGLALGHHLLVGLGQHILQDIMVLLLGDVGALATLLVEVLELDNSSPSHSDWLCHAIWGQHSIQVAACGDMHGFLPDRFNCETDPVAAYRSRHRRVVRVVVWQILATCVAVFPCSKACTILNFVMSSSIVMVLLSTLPHQCPRNPVDRTVLPQGAPCQAVRTCKTPSHVESTWASIEREKDKRTGWCKSKVPHFAPDMEKRPRFAVSTHCMNFIALFPHIPTHSHVPNSGTCISTSYIMFLRGSMWGTCWQKRGLPHGAYLYNSRKRIL